MKTTQRVGLIGVLAASLVMLGGLAQAQVPQLINYQGVLKDNLGAPITGTVNIVFSIYTVPSGGTALWTETQSGVSVTGGLFNVLLGSVTALPQYFFQNGGDRWLGVKVGTDAEMTPRQKLVSIVFALRAEDADTLGAGLVIANRTLGNVGMATGATPPVSQLHVVSESTSASRGLTIGQHNTGLHGALLEARKSRGTYANPLPPGPTDYALAFTNKIYDGTAYINSGAVAFRLDGPVSQGVTPTAVDFITTQTSYGGVSAYGTERMTIRANGNIGIGTMTPTERLQVVGNVRADAFLTPSSRELKKDITPLSGQDYQAILDQIKGIQMVRYLYKQEENRQPHLGVIAEDSPKEILDQNGKAVSLSDYAGFLLAGLKAQSEDIETLKAQIRMLESKVAQ